MSQSISPHDLRRIAATGVLFPRTVERFYKGLPVRSTTRARIEQAARELGLPLPATEGSELDSGETASGHALPPS
jgi:DNA-binding LacI/PurR family transcriptional regulator